MYIHLLNIVLCIYTSEQKSKHPAILLIHLDNALGPYRTVKRIGPMKFWII